MWLAFIMVCSPNFPQAVFGMIHARLSKKMSATWTCDKYLQLLKMPVDGLEQLCAISRSTPNRVPTPAKGRPFWSRWHTSIPALEHFAEFHVTKWQCGTLALRCCSKSAVLWRLRVSLSLGWAHHWEHWSWVVVCWGVDTAHGQRTSCTPASCLV